MPHHASSSAHPSAALPFQLLLVALSPVTVEAATLTVPVPYPTIQSAIDAASAEDTVRVGPGTYNENLSTMGKRLYLVSEAGAEQTIIDGGGRDRVLSMNGGGVVDGFTLRNGFSDGGPNGIGLGGGIYFLGQPGDGIRNNIIEDNVAGPFDAGYGGGIFVEANSTGAVIESNLIRNNQAGFAGGGIYASGSRPYTGVQHIIASNLILQNWCHVSGGGAEFFHTDFFYNLVAGNVSDTGGAGGVHAFESSRITNNTIVSNTNLSVGTSGAGISAYGAELIAHNIVANNENGIERFGAGIACGGTNTRVECNDAWGNSGVDYFFSANAPCDSTGGRNISQDPLFCGVLVEDYRISQVSPCSPSSPLNPGCGLIGASQPGCLIVPIQPTSWGRIKSMYHER